MAAIGTQTAQPLPNVRLIKYSVAQHDVSATHPFARRFDLECRRAEEVLYAATNLLSSGFSPDLILAHPGWGETLPLRSVFPDARMVAYCELFYRTRGQDVGFDPEFPSVGLDGDVNIHLKNAATLLALNESDAGLSPTEWQKSTYPTEYRDKIRVIHEGIDVDLVKPAARGSVLLPSGLALTQDSEVVTFVARAFEPLRGFHIVMRALPRILKERKSAHIVIVGGGAAPYGMRAPEGRTWRSVFFDEIASQVDTSRVHFVGMLPYPDFVKVLQISRAHLYMTYPFVLSWSLLEAMSAGCLVVASETAPVLDVVNNTNGILVPFHDETLLAERVIDALAHQAKYKRLRVNARKTVLRDFDLKRVCLPRLLDFLDLPHPDGGYADEEMATENEEP